MSGGAVQLCTCTSIVPLSSKERSVIGHLTSPIYVRFQCKSTQTHLCVPFPRTPIPTTIWTVKLYRSAPIGRQISISSLACIQGCSSSDEPLRTSKNLNDLMMAQNCGKLHHHRDCGFSIIVKLVTASKKTDHTS